MTTTVACLRIYLLYVLFLCQINPRTIHSSIIFQLSFDHVFAVSHFEKDYCIAILIVCCRDLFDVVKPEKKSQRYIKPGHTDISSHVFLVWGSYVCRSPLCEWRDVCSSPVSSSETCHESAYFHLLCSSCFLTPKWLFQEAWSRHVLSLISSFLAFLCAKKKKKGS